MEDSGTTWLSRGLEQLLAEQQRRRGSHAGSDAARQPDFDVVIVGSGYGGAIAAERLSRAGVESGDRDTPRALSVAVLERGREYLAGMFPSGFSSLAGHTRFSSPAAAGARGQRDGLFDFRIGGDINALVANGLGGGSLINAGVLEIPAPEVFDRRWPRRFRRGRILAPYFGSVRRRLGGERCAPGADGDGAPCEDYELNTIARHPEYSKRPLDKTLSLQRMGGQHFRHAAITVAMEDGPNNSGVQMSRCRLCGDCATGCNFGAKDSLDLNLLVEARRRGVAFYTGATVLELVEGQDMWTLRVKHTDPQLARRQGQPAEIRARRVILAAGTFGSTEILLRSRRRGLALSRRLGEGFSGNGDMLAAGYGQRQRVNAVADETSDFASRRVGPTITGVIDLRGRQPYPLVVEEMAVPGAMRRVFEEIFTTTATLADLGAADLSTHGAGNLARDPLAVDPQRIARTSVYAVIGDDGAGGRLELHGERQHDGDGNLRVRWPGVAGHGLFPAQIRALEELTRASGNGGRVLANPMWRPLPASMEFLLGARRGPLLTVHPLGGCAMADSPTRGVVNPEGQVFTGRRDDPADIYAGLVVLDGSIMPCALATNPALTIAAVAARAVDHLVRRWGYVDRKDETGGCERRPVYRTPEPSQIAPTTMQFAERLQGPVHLYTRKGEQAFQAEITLYFEDKELRQLIACEDDSDGSRHTLAVERHKSEQPAYFSSRLRLFRQADWDELEQRYLSGRLREEQLERLSVLTAPVEGTLTIMGRAPSWVVGRALRAGGAWLLNRGLRDIWQYLFPLPHERQEREAADERGESPGWRRRSLAALKVFTRAGETRLFQYELRVLDAERDPGRLLSDHSRVIRGRKHITYCRRGNPLQQLCELSLDAFPGLARWRPPPRLQLVPEFLARRGLPLFRITAEQDAPQAIADLVSLAAYFLRLLVSIHMFTLRKPDLPPPRLPQRYPGPLPGLPPPQRIAVPVADPEDAPGESGSFVLTRYPARDSAAPPVMLLHGYSASGTTFAHPSLRVDLARYLWRQGRDVWLLDLRSSCAAPTATVNYSFERLARTDIPLALEHICAASGRPSVDVVAHCMGAAMLSMAVLEAGSVSSGARHADARNAVARRVRSAVLSQVGPLVSMAPANVFRAYLFSYLKHQLPLGGYSFAPDGTLFGEVLDRVLAALPYDAREFDLENPVLPWRRTPWATARHRMDLLYGRTFALGNMSAASLAHIDDFFGPLSVDTATQVAHFARFQSITNHGGQNLFVSRARLRRNWRFPTLSLHGRGNGLADVATVGRMARILADAGCDYRHRVFDGFGHQDCLIGSGAEQVYRAIDEFLPRGAADGDRVVLPARDRLTIQVPWSGPVIGPVQSAPDGGDLLPLSFGVNPALSDPLLVVTVPLQESSGCLRAVTDRGVAARLHRVPPPADGWVKMTVPVPAASVAGRLLVLLVYDESPDLDNALFGATEPPVDRSSLDAIDWSALLSGAAARAQVAAAWQCAGEDAEDAIEAATASLAAALSAFLEGREPYLDAGIVRLVRSRHDATLCLALGSCQFPPGILDQNPGFRSYHRLWRRWQPGTAGSGHDGSEVNDDCCDCALSLRQPPDALLLMGDQVYVDPTAGMADPTAQDERFLHPYQRWLRASEVREVLREVPAWMMLDDHEIRDNWEPLPASDAGHSEARRLGTAHYLNFQRGPHQAVAGKYPQDLWYSFEVSGFDVFVADTRTAREHRDALTVHERCLLGARQRAALDAWLRRVAGDDRPKFIVSPAMLLPRLRRALDGPAAIFSDGWEGYPQSLEYVLRRIEELRIENLVFLSGDAHLSFDATLELSAAGGRPLRVRSVHNSPLFAPYPFANASPEDFHLRETFVLPPRGAARALTCEVTTRQVVPGAGFALLEVKREAGSWRVNVCFDREPEVPADEVSTPAAAASAPGGRRRRRPRSGS